MGTITHHAIVVTTWSRPLAMEAHKQATETFGSDGISPLSSTQVNSTLSFCIFPDGSKEWWAESDQGDARRDRFIVWLDTQRYEDGSTAIKWAEVEYGECVGDDTEGAVVSRHFAQKKASDGDD